MELHGQTQTDPEAIPRRASGVQAQSMGDDVLLCQDGDVVVGLNPSAGAIWELCDGSKSIRGIGVELSSAAKVPLATLLPQIEQAVSQLVSAGLLTIAPPSSAEPEPRVRR